MGEPIADTFYKTTTSSTLSTMTGGRMLARPGEPDHLTDLRAAFPNVWVRADGSIQDEEFGVLWNPGDVEAATTRMERNEETGAVETGGLVRFIGADYGRGRVLLKLSQVLALGAYIKAESEKVRG